jgi:hypothetical protein
MSSAVAAVNKGREELECLYREWCKGNQFTTEPRFSQLETERRLTDTIKSDGSCLRRWMPKGEDTFHTVPPSFSSHESYSRPSSAALVRFEQRAGPRSIAFAPAPITGDSGIVSAPQGAYVAETCGGAGMLYLGTLGLGRKFSLELGVTRHIITTPSAFREARADLSTFAQNLGPQSKRIVTSLDNTPLLFALAATEIGRKLDNYTREAYGGFSEQQRMLGVTTLDLKSDATTGEFQILTLGARINPQSNEPSPSEGNCYSCEVQVDWCRDQFGITKAQVRLGTPSLLKQSRLGGGLCLLDLVDP